MDLLIVDDDPTVLTALQRLLATVVPDTWTVATTSDAVAGRALLTLDPRVKIAIVDYLMPRIDGLALVEDVLKHRPSLRGKIIITSGADFPEDIAHRLFVELGCPRLDKPINVDALEALVLKIAASP